SSAQPMPIDAAMSRSPLAMVSTAPRTAPLAAVTRPAAASPTNSSLALAASRTANRTLKPSSQARNWAWAIASTVPPNWYRTLRLGGVHSTLALALASTLAWHSALTSGGSTLPSHLPWHRASAIAETSHLAVAPASQLAPPGS